VAQDSGARDRLRSAVHNDNANEIAALGWYPIFEALGRMWAKRLDKLDRLAYASAVGDRDPKDVLDAILNKARDGGIWRPTPSELAGLTRRGSATNTVALSLPDYRLPETLRLVAEMLIEGAYVCECKGRSFSYEKTVKGVLMCPQCGGLEPGQADDAVALGSRETAA
jgi:hypothetical protein